jgi:hypothetical protein
VAKLSVLAGSTGQSLLIFIEDGTSATGAGKTGLLFSSFPSSHVYYTFAGTNTAATAITLVTIASVGAAFTSGGFLEIDSTNLPGLYRFDPPNASIAANKGRSVVFMFQGAAGAAPLLLEIELTGTDNQLSAIAANITKVGGTAIPTAITPGVLVVDTREVCYEGISQNIGNTTTSTIGDGAGSATINAYNGMRLHFRAGTGSPADAIITGWDGSIFTHTAVLVPAGADTVFRVLPGIVSVQDIAAKAFACTIGFAAGSIGLGTFSPALKQTFSRGYLVSTGNASPTATGVWTQDALWNNEPTYLLASGAFAAWMDTDTTWKISPAVGNFGTLTNYWQTAVGASVTGPYVKGSLAPGTTTGIPVIAYHGNGVLGAFQPASSVIGAAVLDVPASSHATAGTIGAAIGATGTGGGRTETVIQRNETVIQS